MKHLFDIPESFCYLNCAYMSPLLKSVATAGHAGVSRKSRPWELSASDFFTESEQARSLFAQLVNSSADNVALIPAASYGISTACQALPLKADSQIVVLDEQFPSNVYPWMNIAEQRGISLRTVKRQVGQSWTEAVLQALQQFGGGVVALPQCHWTDGAMLDLKAIGDETRNRNGYLVLDTTQSLGAMPLDVEHLKPDFLVSAAYKWLLGPYSTGFMYVDPSHHGALPLEHNWIDRRNSEDFARLVDYQTEYQPGARRFDVGERANFALMPMVIAALQQILAWKVGTIQEKLAQYTSDIEQFCLEMGLSCDTIPDRAGHFLGIRFPDGLPPGILDQLARQNIFVSVRGDSMRVTPHLYNDESDYQQFTNALKQLL